jgi:hypothetical protein
MPRFEKVSYDPIIHKLIASDDRLADCLIPAFEAILSGATVPLPAHLSKRVFWTEACGYIFYITVSSNGRFAEVSGYRKGTTKP